MEIKPSTRALSVLELLDVLQEEYFICELRAKIYPVSHVNFLGVEIRHSDYWKRIAEKKKEKIYDIVRRKRIVCIFDDEKLYKEVENRVIPKIGYPKFMYRDSFQQLRQEKWDLHNYYSKKAEVSALINNELLIGNIAQIDFNEKKVEVKIKDDSMKIVDFHLVTRILT